MGIEHFMVWTRRCAAMSLAEVDADARFVVQGLMIQWLLLMI